LVSKKLITLMRNYVLTDEKYVSYSGTEKSYYVDVKGSCTDPIILKMLTKEIYDEYKYARFDKIAGIAIGGIPLVCTLSMKLEIPSIIFRKNRNKMGIGSNYIGSLNEGDKVFLLNDVTSSGVSIIDVINFVKLKGAKVEFVVTIVDRELGAKRSIESLGIEFFSLINYSKLI